MKTQVTVSGPYISATEINIPHPLENINKRLTVGSFLADTFLTDIYGKLTKTVKTVVLSLDLDNLSHANYILTINNVDRIYFNRHINTPSEEKLRIIVDYIEELEHYQTYKDKVDLGLVEQGIFKPVNFGLPFYSNEEIYFPQPYYYARKSYDEFLEFKLDWARMLGLESYTYNYVTGEIEYDRNN